MRLDLQNVPYASPDSLVRFIRERLEEIRAPRRLIDRFPKADTLDWCVVAQLVLLLAEEQRRPASDRGEHNP